MGFTCEIFVRKSPTGAFNAGETVSGIVKYGINEPTKFKKIEMSLVGRAECRYEKYTNSTNSVQSFGGSEDFVSNTKNLLQNRPDQSVTLSAGFYEHPFEFVLPKDIPSSYQSRGSFLSLSGRNYSCRVTYLVKMTFEKASFFSFYKTFEKELVVYGNLNPIAPDEPVTYGLKKSLLKPFSDRNQSITIKGTILKSFLAPGEETNLKIDIVNNSDVVIAAVKCELLRSISLHANKSMLPYKDREIIEQTIKDCTCEQVNNSEQKNISFLMKLPTKPDLYSIQHSRIVAVDYVVRATVKLPLPHINACLDIPVVIGEKPNTICEEILELDDEDYNVPPAYWEVMAETKTKDMK